MPPLSLSSRTYSTAMVRGRQNAPKLAQDEAPAPEQKAVIPGAQASVPSASSLPPLTSPTEVDPRQRTHHVQYHVPPRSGDAEVQHMPSSMNANGNRNRNFENPLAPPLEPYPQQTPNPQPCTNSHFSMALPESASHPPASQPQHPSSHHHHHVYPYPRAHLQTNGTGVPHEQPPPTPEQLPGNYTYANLTDGIVSHVFFPLVLKKIFEHLTQRQLPANHSAAHFDVLEQRALELKRYGEVYGLEGACEKYASVDLFMSAMVTSLSGLQQRVNAGSIDALLADTLAVASASIQNQHGSPSGAGLSGSNPGNQAGVPIEGRPASRIAAGSGVVKSLGPRIMDDDMGAPRRKLKPQARRCLEEWFQSHLESPYPTDAEKQALATQCQLEIQQVRSDEHLLLILKPFITRLARPSRSVIKLTVVSSFLLLYSAASQVNNFFGNKRMRMKRKMMAVSRPDRTPVSGHSSSANMSAGSPAGKQKESGTFLVCKLTLLCEGSEGDNFQLQVRYAISLTASCYIASYCIT